MATFHFGNVIAEHICQCLITIIKDAFGIQHTNTQRRFGEEALEFIFGSLQRLTHGTLCGQIMDDASCSDDALTLMHNGLTDRRGKGTTCGAFHDDFGHLLRAAMRSDVVRARIFGHGFKVCMQRAFGQDRVYVFAEPARQCRVYKHKAAMFINREEANRRVIRKVDQLFAFITDGTVRFESLRNVVDTPMNIACPASYRLCCYLIPVITAIIHTVQFNRIRKTTMCLIGQHTEMRQCLLVFLKEFRDIRKRRFTKGFA